MRARRVEITAGDVAASAQLNDSPTAGLVWEALPIKSGANTWGDEIHFRIDVQARLEIEAQETVELGTIGYWPPGHALCLFFGPTQLSSGAEIRPASALNGAWDD